MQSQISQNQMFETPEPMLEATASLDASEQPATAVEDNSEPIWFNTQFSGTMEMYADIEIVAKHFDEHENWFRRCAHPMTAEPIGKTGYALTIGRFGAFGYQVEPKVGLDLLPQNQGLYLIQTIPVPDYTPPGYEVDFKAAQKLVEVAADFAPHLEEKFNLPQTITRVEWNLDLTVGVSFPKFIRKLPLNTIKNSGDRLLAEIVKQVSRCLTYKVQEDFHSSLGGECLSLFKKNVALKRQVATCEQIK